MDGWMHRGVYGWMDEWMGRWVGDWMDRQLDRRMLLVNTSITVNESVKKKKKNI